MLGNSVAPHCQHSTTKYFHSIILQLHQYYTQKQRRAAFVHCQSSTKRIISPPTSRGTCTWPLVVQQPSSRFWFATAAVSIPFPEMLYEYTARDRWMMEHLENSWDVGSCSIHMHLWIAEWRDWCLSTMKMMSLDCDWLWYQSYA